MGDLAMPLVQAVVTRVSILKDVDSKVMRDLALSPIMQASIGSMPDIASSYPPTMSDHCDMLA